MHWKYYERILFDYCNGWIINEKCYNIGNNHILGGIKLKNDKIEELSSETVKLLEKTKKDYKKYETERKKLYEYFVNKNDVEKWEAYIKELKELINEKLWEI